MGSVRSGRNSDLRGLTRNSRLGFVFDADECSGYKVGLLGSEFCEELEYGFGSVGSEFLFERLDSKFQFGIGLVTRDRGRLARF